MNYNVQINLCGNILHVKTDVKLQTDDAVYYYLYSSSGEVIKKSGWISKTEFKFEIVETDSYFVKVYIRHGEEKSSFNSDYIDYVSEVDQKKFENFCQTRIDTDTFKNINPWHLYHMKRPYSNFAFLYGDFSCEKIEKLCENYNFDFVNDIISAQTTGLIKEKDAFLDGEKYILSGMARSGKKLVLGGMDKIEEEDEYIFSGECLGAYTFFNLNDQCIEIGTDYFGVGKIYYYKDANNFVCSNVYHMLLLVLSAMGKELKLDEEIVSASLCKMNQSYAQRFSRFCEIANISMLPVGKKIRIGESVDFVDTAISSDFEVEGTASDEEYIQLLRAGKQEILDNAEAVLNCSHADKIMLELSGGLDSRTAYSAFTNFDLKKHNLYIRTSKGSNENDTITASKVNSVYKLPWDTCPRTIRKLSYKQVENDINSHFVLGGYYVPRYVSGDYILEYIENEDKTLSISGHFGDICCRPYFTRNLLEKIDNVETYDFEQLASSFIGRKDVLSAKSYKNLSNVLKKELNELPGKSCIEKYEIYFLFYSNSFHYLIMREYQNGLTWGVLQSKNMYRLCRKTYYDKKDIKTQLDIMHQLNPILTCIPFELERNNIAKEKLQNDLYYEDKRYKNVHLDIKSQMEEWEEAHKKLRENNNYLKQDDVEQINKDNAIWKEQWDKRLEVLLYRLMQYKNGVLKQQFGLEVYVSFLIKRDKTDSFYQMLYNKLLSIYLQLCIIDREFDELFQ